MNLLYAACLASMLLACAGESTNNSQSSSQPTPNSAAESVEIEMQRIDNETEAILDETKSIENELNDMLNDLDEAE